MARIARETFIARIADLLRRSGDDRAEWRIKILEENLPEALASTEVEFTHDEAGRWIRRGPGGVSAAAKIYRLHAHTEFPHLFELEASLDEARRREMRMSEDPPPMKRAVAYHYTTPVQREIRRQLRAILEESGAQDVPELIRLLDLNLTEIGANEDLVLQSIKAGRLIDAANFLRQRVRLTREEARAEIARRKRALESP